MSDAIIEISDLDFAYRDALVLKLSEQIGHEKGAARLGLNRFSIDPNLMRASGEGSTGRMTLGKRVTPDLHVVYSQDLSGTQPFRQDGRLQFTQRTAIVVGRKLT